MLTKRLLDEVRDFSTTNILGELLEGMLRRDVKEQVQTRLAVLDDSDDGSGIIFTAQDLLLIEAYKGAMLKLPATLASARTWLGYATIANKALAPSAMLQLFSALRKHADQWGAVRASSKVLVLALVRQVAEIQRCSALVCNLMRQCCRHSGSAALSFNEQCSVDRIKDELRRLMAEVGSFDSQLRKELPNLTAFRTEYRETLAPAVLSKTSAAQAYGQSVSFEQKYQELLQLDLRISELRAQHATYARQARQFLTRLLSLFSGRASLFSRLARSTRAEYLELERQRQRLAKQLREYNYLSGRMESLRSNLESIDLQLSSALVSTEYLHSAWQCLSEYLGSSIALLDEVETHTDLEIVTFYFSMFAEQWSEIGRQANRMSNVL